jgi:hypothetical protein
MFRGGPYLGRGRSSRHAELMQVQSRCATMKRLTVRTGRQAMLAVLAVSAALVTLVYLASLPVTEPDGTLDPSESVVDPD